VGLLWWWVIPSAYFWQVASRTDSFLPYVPRGIWGLPGELWRVAPAIYVLIVAAVTYVVVVFVADRRPRRSVSIVAGVFIAIVTITHLLWGGVLLSAA
jgi:hypothetical protein